MHHRQLDSRAGRRKLCCTLPALFTISEYSCTTFSPSAICKLQTTKQSTLQSVSYGCKLVLAAICKFTCNWALPLSKCQLGCHISNQLQTVGSGAHCQHCCNLISLLNSPATISWLGCTRSTWLQTFNPLQSVSPAANSSSALSFSSAAMHLLFCILPRSP